MIGAFVILGVLVLVGVILYIGEIQHRRKAAGATGATEETEATETTMATGATVATGAAEEAGGECCGLHLVCEKDSLSPMSAEVEYYDDEELDRFIGRDGSDYTPEEEEEFRDVLMTLRPADVAGWARSITARRLNLPPDVRDELLLLINEQRRSS